MTKQPAERLHLTISGDVQGVMFRAYTQQRARELDVTGWVRNLWNAKVEALAEGERERLEQLVAWCPRYAQTVVGRRLPRRRQFLRSNLSARL